MKRGTLTALIGAIMALGLVGTAVAANVHWKRQPTFTDQGTTLKISGALAGLGNEDVTITAVAEGVATSITCTNPAGKKAPGQNKPNVESLGDMTISREEIKNGNVSFTLLTEDPEQLTAREAGCPNNRWTAEINDVRFDKVTITVIQGGEEVLRDEFDL